MIQIGSKVQVRFPPVACCGVIRQGHEGVVREMIKSSAGNILVLEDNSVHLEYEVILCQ